MDHSSRGRKESDTIERLNFHFSQLYFDFIAAFRLEEARELLSQVYKSKEWELTDEMIQTRHEQIFRIYLLFK